MHAHIHTHTHTHTQSTKLINEDEEIAHLFADENKLLLSQDEELARQLQEEEERSAREAAQQGVGGTALDRDHQLALQLQKEQLVIVSPVPRPPPFHSLVYLGSFQGVWLSI